MYKLVLILKYLTRKIAPMFAALAVTLCTAMVIIVISVMGGFLSLLRDAAHQLTGDVIVATNAYNGFPRYAELIERLEATEPVELATPAVQTLGLVKIGQQSVAVQLMGVKPRELDRIVRYRESLYWTAQKYFNYQPPGSNADGDGAGDGTASLGDGPLDQFELIDGGMTFQPPKLLQQATAEPRPGLVLGIEANPRSRRDREGNYKPIGSAVGEEVVLTVVPVGSEGGLREQMQKRMQVVNEFKSGVHEIDSRRGYMDFSLLQQLLRMEPAEEVDPATGEPTGETIPGRAHQVIAKAAPGFTPDEALEASNEVLAAMTDQYPAMPPIRAQTWEDRHRTILRAVQNEKLLVTILFSIISIVAVVMVAQTFYMIVLEKTRDIGVLRAMGASKLGILNMYLGYGLALGIVGAIIGLAIAWLIVTNVNQLQDLIAQWTGWRMWDPRVYMFDEIPAEIDWQEAAVICLGAVVSSIIGALIPALLAARLNPVEAIRHE